LLMCRLLLCLRLRGSIVLRLVWPLRLLLLLLLMLRSSLTRGSGCSGRGSGMLLCAERAAPFSMVRMVVRLRVRLFLRWRRWSC